MNNKCPMCGADLEGQSTFYEDGKLFCVYRGKRVASCLAKYKEERKREKGQNLQICTPSQKDKEGPKTL